MIWFLRLFPAYRAMESHAKQCERLQYEQQGRMAELMRHNDYLTAQVDKARAGELYAIKTIANYSAQQLYRVAPFEEAAQLPIEESQSGPIPPAAEAVTQAFLRRQTQDATKRFMAKLRENYSQAEYVVPEN